MLPSLSQRRAYHRQQQQGQGQRPSRMGWWGAAGAGALGLGAAALMEEGDQLEVSDTHTQWMIDGTHHKCHG